MKFPVQLYRKNNENLAKTRNINVCSTVHQNRNIFWPKILTFEGAVMEKQILFA
jgi:hypothetical protein